MTKAREIAELGQKLTVDGSGNLDIAGDFTTQGFKVADGTSGQVDIWSDAYNIQGGSNFGDMRFNAPRFRFYEDSSRTFELSGGNAYFFGSTVFNEDGGDKDFRVEGDTQSHMLFVDAANDSVGIRCTDPSKTFALQIGSQSPSTGAKKTLFQTMGGRYSTDSSTSNQYQLMGFVGTTFSETDVYTHTTGEVAKNFYMGLAADSAYFNGNRFVIVQGGQERLKIDGYASPSVIINEGGVDADFRVESDANAHALFVDAATSRVGIYTNTPSRKLTVRDDNPMRLEANSNPTDYYTEIGTRHNYNQSFVLEHKTKMLMEFSDGSGLKIRGNRNDGYGHIRLYPDSNSATGKTGSGMYMDTNIVVFNDESDDRDFRVESDSNANALFVDAGNDRVGVKTSSTESTAALTVNGNISTIGGITNYGGYKWHSGIDLGTTSGSSDWILVAPYSTGSTGQAAAGIFGKIYITRGNTGTWNDSSVIDVGIKTAWDSTEIPTWVGNETLQRVTYNSVDYCAFEITGSTRKVFFQGYTVGSFRPIKVAGSSVTYVSDIRSSDDPILNYHNLTNRSHEAGSWTPQITSTAGTTTSSNVVYYEKTGNQLLLFGRAEFLNLATTHGGAHLNLTTPFALKSGSAANSTDVPLNFWGPSMDTNLWNTGMPGISVVANGTTHGMYSHGAAVNGVGYNAISGTEAGDGTCQISFATVVFT